MPVITCQSCGYVIVNPLQPCPSCGTIISGAKAQPSGLTYQHDNLRKKSSRNAIATLLIVITILIILTVGSTRFYYSVKQESTVRGAKVENINPDNSGSEKFKKGLLKYGGIVLDE